MMTKIFCGIIYKEEEIYQKALHLLKEKFGETEIESEFIPFNFTDYYEEEMGKNLKRRYISFSSLQSLENPYKWKVLTGRIEKQLSLSGSRQINIDPGYLTLSKVVLFSTKNYYHRIYLGEGIFAEVTLRWHNKKYEIFPWTYPDYKTEFAKEFFTNMREIYSIQIKSPQH
ncbi:MAG: DUF4416 family protein [Candidatus Omnitrophica bacterium]|nr:DUF4416 family protein [Candidatus Omnitrophota bacterium]